MSYVKKNLRDKKFEKVWEHLSEDHVDGKHDADLVETSGRVADVHFKLWDPIVTGSGVARVRKESTLHEPQIYIFIATSRTIPLDFTKNIVRVMIFYLNWILK